MATHGKFSLGGDFDIRVLPWVWVFDIATTCFGQKALPRNLTFSRCPGLGNLTLALVKMSNFSGSAPPDTLGLNIDRCIIQTNQYGYKVVNRLFFSCPIPGLMLG